MVFEKERKELIELFKARHLVVLNDLTEIKHLLRNNDSDIEQINIALANIKHFLTKPRYFYAILDFIATNYSISEFDLVKCNGFKLVFEILRTICFYLLKDPNHEEYSKIKRTSETAKLLNELLDDDLIDVIFHDIGFKVDYLTDSYVYANKEANRIQTLVDMAFDAYLNFYFYDNVLHFIQDYLNPRFRKTCEPLKVIEFLYKNQEIKCYDYKKMYAELNGRGYLQNIHQEELEVVNIEQLRVLETPKEEPKRASSPIVVQQIKEERKIVNNTEMTSHEEDSYSDYNNNSASLLRILTNEQWPCAGCTYLNEPDKTTCALCYTAKYIPNATFL